MRPEFARPWVRFPAGLRCVLSSDPAVSSSIFVGDEREGNLIRDDPDKSEFTIERLDHELFGAKFFSCGLRQIIQICLDSPSAPAEDFYF